MQTYIQRRNYTNKCHRRNMCTGGGAWRLVIYPDNFTYLSVIGRICVWGEGAWWWLKTRRMRTQAHQWAANYFLVRMVVPRTKLVENPCLKSQTLTGIPFVWQHCFVLSAHDR